METLRLLTLVNDLMEDCFQTIRDGRPSEARFYASLAAHYARIYLGTTFGC